MSENSYRPWRDRAKELEPYEGAYCDFAAWREWFNAKAAAIDQDDLLDRLDACESAFLYSIFCRCVEESREPSHE